jgi:hypothetical protein
VENSIPLNSIEIGEKVGKVRLDKMTAVGKAIKTYEVLYCKIIRGWGARGR